MVLFCFWCMSKSAEKKNAICLFWRLVTSMVHILIYVLLHNAHTFYLYITNNDAKKVTALKIPEWKVGNKSSDTRTERFRVKMKVSSANGYLRAPAANFFNEYCSSSKTILAVAK